MSQCNFASIILRGSKSRFLLFFDDNDVHARIGQNAGEAQARRPRTDDNDIAFLHGFPINI